MSRPRGRIDSRYITFVNSFDVNIANPGVVNDHHGHAAATRRVMNGGLFERRLVTCD